ncbi:MAG: antibiotic biosynthesis monooxygenase family protein [Flavobacterium sp.]
MIAVIFEAILQEGKKQNYLDLAQSLKEELSVYEGLLSIERFVSVQDPERLLSLSFWDSEESIEKWRNQVSHRKVQCLGRTEVFSDYRLRIGMITRDYSLLDREQAPVDSKLSNQ